MSQEPQWRPALNASNGTVPRERETANARISARQRCVVLRRRNRTRPESPSRGGLCASIGSVTVLSYRVYTCTRVSTDALESRVSRHESTLYVIMIPPPGYAKCNMDMRSDFYTPITIILYRDFFEVTTFTALYTHSATDSDTPDSVLRGSDARGQGRHPCESLSVPYRLTTESETSRSTCTNTVTLQWPLRVPVSRSTRIT